MVAEGSLPTNDTVVIGAQGPNFPVTWNPRYAYAVRRVALSIMRSLSYITIITGGIWCKP
jgi:hypothetical protein